MRYYNKSACRQLKYPCISEKSDAPSLFICYLKVLERQVSLLILLGTPRVFSTVNFSDILIAIYKTTFKELWADLLDRFFFFFSPHQIFGYACLSVPNCRLVDNIFVSFCTAQISILGIFTVAKCRCHTNFVLSIVHSMDFGRVSSQYDRVITS